MQREILFRGKRIDNGEWIDGYYIGFGCSIVTTKHEFDSMTVTYQVHPESVGQFTGILDKNGKKVFFDDTYKDPDGDVFKVTQNEYGTYVLEMISNGFIDEFIDWNKIEIIGNVHDNPDLLK